MRLRRPLVRGTESRVVAAQYREFSSDPSFVDYFWTVRTMHAPIWTLAEVAANLIPVRAYHSASTGYAGLLGALTALVSVDHLLPEEQPIMARKTKADEIGKGTPVRTVPPARAPPLRLPDEHHPIPQIPCRRRPW